MNRENILHKVRSALGRGSVREAAAGIQPRLRVVEAGLEEKIRQFAQAFQALGGTFWRAESYEDVFQRVAGLLNGRSAVASNAPILRNCRIETLSGVVSDFHEEARLRLACATADIGITGADYALADTGSLVMFSSPAEARMISLLPPVHVAVVAKERILTGLDELFTLTPLPAEVSSSMVIITGPSRTADIEQILVRGVHGPGEIHAIVV